MKLPELLERVSNLLAGSNAYLILEVGGVDVWIPVDRPDDMLVERRECRDAECQYTLGLLAASSIYNGLGHGKVSLGARSARLLVVTGAGGEGERGLRLAERLASSNMVESITVSMVDETLEARLKTDAEIEVPEPAARLPEELLEALGRGLAEHGRVAAAYELGMVTLGIDWRFAAVALVDGEARVSGEARAAAYILDAIAAKVRASASIVEVPYPHVFEPTGVYETMPFRVNVLAAAGPAEEAESLYTVYGRRMRFLVSDPSVFHGPLLYLREANARQQEQLAIDIRMLTEPGLGRLNGITLPAKPVPLSTATIEAVASLYEMIERLLGCEGEVEAPAGLGKPWAMARATIHEVRMERVKPREAVGRVFEKGEGLEDAMATLATLLEPYAKGTIPAVPESSTRMLEEHSIRATGPATLLAATATTLAMYTRIDRRSG